MDAVLGLVGVGLALFVALFGLISPLGLLRISLRGEREGNQRIPIAQVAVHGYEAAGLTPTEEREVRVLVAFARFIFALGLLILGGFIFLVVT